MAVARLLVFRGREGALQEHSELWGVAFLLVMGMWGWGVAAFPGTLTAVFCLDPITPSASFLCSSWQQKSSKELSSPPLSSYSPPTLKIRLLYLLLHWDGLSRPAMTSKLLTPMVDGHSSFFFDHSAAVDTALTLSLKLSLPRPLCSDHTHPLVISSYLM